MKSSSIGADSRTEADKPEKPNPDRLFKYRSLAGESRRYLERTFSHCEIYYASPRDFNDPFDCRVHMIFPKDRMVYSKLIAETMKDKNPEMNRRSRRRYAAERVKKVRPESNPKLQQALVSDLQEGVDKMGVFSLCENPNDLLMWSHYATGHTGICLEFDIYEDFGVPFQVRYSSSFPAIHLLQDPEEQIDAILLRKAAGWSYEHEWRIIDHERGSGIRTFRPQRLSGVIFGCRTSQADRDQVRQWIDSGPTSPRLHEARIETGKYQLEIAPIK